MVHSVGSYDCMAVGSNYCGCRDNFAAWRSGGDLHESPRHNERGRQQMSPPAKGFVWISARILTVVGEVCGYTQEHQAQWGLCRPMPNDQAIK